MKINEWSPTLHFLSICWRNEANWERKIEGSKGELSWLVWVDWFGWIKGCCGSHCSAQRKRAQHQTNKDKRLWVEWWNGMKWINWFDEMKWNQSIYEWQWNGINQRRPKRSAVREQTTQQPLIAAGRGKPAINWWLVCLLRSLGWIGLPPRSSARPLFHFFKKKWGRGSWLWAGGQPASKQSSHSLFLVFIVE